MNKDFQSWVSEKKDLISHLKSHNSILFDRVYETLESLLYIDSLEEKDVDEDMHFIFDTGYAYLYGYFNELELYLKNYFDNDFHELIEHEDLVNYAFYLSDVKDVLIDENVYSDTVSEEFEYVLDDIDQILMGEKAYSDNKLDEYNERTMSVMPMNKTYLTVPEIFVDVYYKLKL